MGCVCLRKRKSNVPLETAFKPTWCLANSGRSSRASARQGDVEMPLKDKRQQPEPVDEAQTPKVVAESTGRANGYRQPATQSRDPSEPPSSSEPKSADSLNGSPLQITRKDRNKSTSNSAASNSVKLADVHMDTFRNKQVPTSLA